LKIKRLFGVDGDFVELTVDLEHETDLAYLVSIDGQQAWIPKSKIEDFDLIKGQTYKMIIPEWLAEKKELI